MPESPTTAVPQVALTTGRRHRPLPPCAGCGEAIDPEAEHYVCWAGCGSRPEVLAAAHPGRWGDDDDSYDDACPAALRRLWEGLLAEAGAAVLRLGTDAGGNRFFAGDVGLHAGTAIEVLTPQGTWQPARFEYDVATWSPLAYVALGGWDAPQAAFTIPAGAVVRLAPERRR